MSDSSSTAHINAAAVGTPLLHRARNHWLLQKVPAYFYLVLLYLALEVTIRDMHAVFFAISWAELLGVIAFLVSYLELLKVARPGEDDTDDVIVMIIMAVVMIVLCALSFTSGFLGIFHKPEFYLLTVYACIESIMGLIFNARTLKRSITYDSASN